jgi:hypothetical protein
MCLHLLWDVLHLLWMDFRPCIYIYIYIYIYLLASLTMLLIMFPKFQIFFHLERNGCWNWSPKSSPIYHPRSFFWWMTIEEKSFPLFFLLTHMLQSPGSFGCGHELQIKVTKLLLEELKEWWLSEGIQTNFCAQLRFFWLQGILWYTVNQVPWVHQSHGCE